MTLEEAKKAALKYIVDMPNSIVEFKLEIVLSEYLHPRGQQKPTEPRNYLIETFSKTGE